VSVDRSKLPEPGLSPLYMFPPIEKSVLPNGLQIWSVAHPAIPLVSVLLLIKRGAADDPVEREGLAAMTLDMLDEGSGSLSAIEMHEALARIGAQLESDIGSDAALIGTTVLSRFTDRAMALLADMVARPSLREHDFDRVRQLRQHRLIQLRDLPGAVADRTFASLLYGAHPYGHTPLGTEQSLAVVDPQLNRPQNNYLGNLQAIIQDHLKTIIAVGIYFAFARLGLTDGYGGLILAHTTLAVPFVVVTVLATLSGFDRTLLRAAHDRRFLAALTNRVLELTPGAARSYGGGYLEYVAASGHEAPGMRS
jgi:hypothetical protein